MLEYTIMSRRVLPMFGALLARTTSIGKLQLAPRPTDSLLEVRYHQGSEHQTNERYHFILSPAEKSCGSWGNCSLSWGEKLME